MGTALEGAWVGAAPPTGHPWWRRSALWAMGWVSPLGLGSATPALWYSGAVERGAMPLCRLRGGRSLSKATPGVSCYSFPQFFSRLSPVTGFWSVTPKVS